MASLNITHAADNTSHSSSDYITPETNQTGQLTPIASISPERGMFLKLLNRVNKGSQIGLPIYSKLRDANGNPLPTDTTLALAIKPLGEDQWLLVSEKQDNISYWNQNSITTQRDVENVDSVKIPLKYPAGVNGEGRPSAVNVNGVDEMYVLAESASVIGWDHSELYVESQAVSKGRN